MILKLRPGSILVFTDIDPVDFSFFCLLTLTLELFWFLFLNVFTMWCNRMSLKMEGIEP